MMKTALNSSTTSFLLIKSFQVRKQLLYNSNINWNIFSINFFSKDSRFLKMTRNSTEQGRKPQPDAIPLVTVNLATKNAIKNGEEKVQPGAVGGRLTHTDD